TSFSSVLISTFMFILLNILCLFFFFFSSRRRHTRSLRDWSSDVCSSDLGCQQLVVYQFMDNGPDHYCPGCTWFTNNVPSTAPSMLAEKGTGWVTVSDMPLAQIERDWTRTGWTVPYASARGTTFSTGPCAGSGFRLSVFVRTRAGVSRTYASTGGGT